MNRKFVNKAKYLAPLSIIFVFFLIAAYDVGISQKVFPITEGWWETYAWLGTIDHSLYGSSGLKLPPLFTLLIQFTVDSLGLGYLYSRYCFILVHLFAILILYKWLRFFVGKPAALISVAVTTALVMSNPVYLPKDYHTLVALLVISTFYLLELFNDASKYQRKPLILFLLGLICGLLLITKQNIGVFFTVSVVIYISLISYQQATVKNKVFLQSLLTFIVGYLIPAGLLTYYEPNWISIFISNDSKGSIFTVLFRFISDQSQLKFLIATFAILIGFFILDIKKIVHQVSSKGYFRFPKYGCELRIIFFISTIIFLSIKLQAILFVLALSWTILRIDSQLFNQSEKVRSPYLFIPLLGFAYCGTQTAGYNAVSMDVLVAFFIAEVIDLLLARLVLFNKDNNSYIVLAPLVFMLISLPKLLSGIGYEWWGLKAGGILLKTENTLPFPELKGIKTDAATKAMFESIASVKHKLYKNDSVFAYPSIPIVYELLKIKPLGPPILWFDVSTDRDATTIIHALNSSPPKFIFWLRPPKFVYEGHFHLRQSDPAMTMVDHWVLNNLCNNKYTISKVIVAYDPFYNFETKQEKKIAYKYMCNIDGSENTSSLTWSNASGYKKYIESKKALFDVDDHVFYLLELNVPHIQ